MLSCKFKYLIFVFCCFTSMHYIYLHKSNWNRYVYLNNVSNALKKLKNNNWIISLSLFCKLFNWMLDLIHCDFFPPTADSKAFTLFTNKRQKAAALSLTPNRFFIFRSLLCSHEWFSRRAFHLTQISASDYNRLQSGIWSSFSLAGISA